MGSFFGTSRSIITLRNKSLLLEVGQVVEVAFDPTKPHSNDYELFKVRFDVSKPLRKSKVVNLPEGGQATIMYAYEGIHKRCFYC